ncbi:spore germination protein (plasmid) [Bacillus cereus]|uniref:Spore germination protein KA n=1 Tax=Bacillus cereus (strain ZK / E33L) TaxID=288681 RepID=Q4V1V8_BACCZ|nr:spore germination protein [Bacillus cereus]AAY60299.1 spore germination protein KA [Bacillus cereus E33L]AJI26198.1 GerA spore germination protein [Bacillus cereus E33L]QQA19118.1 spore germination protein [Bacillus cereus]
MLFRNNRKRFRFQNQKQLHTQQQDNRQQSLLSSDLDGNLKVLRSMYKDCFDVIFRTFWIGGQAKATLIYVEGLSNVEEIDNYVLTPLMSETEEIAHSLHEMLEKKIHISKIKEVKTFADCIENISIGNPVLLVQQEMSGLALGLPKWEKRSIEEPEAESVVRGPREGFVETLGVNTALLRKKIKSPDFKMKSIKIGRYTDTSIVIAYIEGIADQTLIEEVQNRLQRIEIDGVLESGYIEELIEDNPYSPFPQLLNTERPDVAAANLLEGRVIILVDGTPFVLIAPISFFSLLQSPEDYYQRFLISSAIRLLRFVFMVFSLVLPSLYVAILTYHQEMVPTSLLISAASSREAVPFPALVEALMMEVTFEALREAGVRLPKQVGAAVSIVGALVIGQAAVQAGLVSAPMVIVVAITGVSSFMVPHYTQGIALRMLRFPIMFLAGSLGLLGVMLGMITIVVHLCTLRSFGIPYLTPIAPMKGRELKDTLIRAPWWMMNTRPRLTSEYSQYRQAPDQKPDPSKGDES